MTKSSSPWLCIIGLCIGLTVMAIPFVVRPCEQNDGKIPIAAGQVVVSKLGVRGIVIQQTPAMYGYGLTFDIRISGGKVETWAPSEIDYVETR